MDLPLSLNTFFKVHTRLYIIRRECFQLLFILNEFRVSSRVHNWFSDVCQFSRFSKLSVVYLGLVHCYGRENTDLR